MSYVRPPELAMGIRLGHPGAADSRADRLG